MKLNEIADANKNEADRLLDLALRRLDVLAEHGELNTRARAALTKTVELIEQARQHLQK